MWSFPPITSLIKRKKYKLRLSKSGRSTFQMNAKARGLVYVNKGERGREKGFKNPK